MYLEVEPNIFIKLLHLDYNTGSELQLLDTFHNAHA